MIKHSTLIIISLLFLSFLSSRSFATIEIPDFGFGSDVFKMLVENCLKDFEGMGEPIAGYIAVLKASKNVHNILPKKGSPNSNRTNDPQKERYRDNHTNGDGTGTTILWDPNNHENYPGTDIARDPCASLLHELFHAYASETGTTNGTLIGGIPAYEIDAACAENYYRFKKGLPQRKTYGGSALPSDCIFK